MGVHGLWELLAPVGRRVSVETLAGKRLAVDASIWMVQFMRAMRDEKGDMVRDAHLLGFLRRICKLLFLRARPVFVFDGGTPALKRRTLAARRRHRDAAQAKIRKTAEKLLLSHLKARKLEELAAEIRSDRAKHDAKGKQVKSGRVEGSDEANGNGNGESSTSTAASIDQEKLDELLAASLAAEEEADLTDKGKGPSTSVPMEETGSMDEDDDDEEMIFPVTTSSIDPAVLASLPPSMQLDLLVQMRERVMAENRQKYQQIKKAPAKFSELQIQSYLKTVAFRREIDEVQKCAAGKVLGGVQTSKIASEANREFIFSSSFTGDKQILTKRAGNDQDANVGSAKNQIGTDVFKSNAPSGSKSSEEALHNEPLRGFGPDVETFRDEKGHIRVSRVRALGIRMTRDIQRNLDFIKEYEQAKIKGAIHVDQGSTRNEESLHFPEHLFESNGPQSSLGTGEDYTETINEDNQLSSLVGGSDNVGESSFPEGKETIEISFLEDQSEVKDKDDQIFLHLVSSSNLSSDNDRSAKIAAESDDSECIWEEGVVEGEIMTMKGDEKELNSSLMDNSYKDEVEWEEGVCDAPGVPSSSEYQPSKVLKGDLEEEALMQEAIMRSLVDFEKQNSENVIPEDIRASSEDRSSGSDNDIPKSAGNTPSKTDLVKVTVEETGIHTNSDTKDVTYDTALVTADRQDDQNVAQLVNTDRKSDLNRTYSQGCVPSSNISVSTSGAESPISNSLKVRESSEMTCANILNPEVRGQSKFLAADANVGETSAIAEEDLMMGSPLVDAEIQKVTKGNLSFFNSERAYTAMGGNNDESGVSEASLEKEISHLRQEQVDLGNERRKLESHAESVSSEMFAECQELLQMFGLPYIIAPMEAEAQCAYMEMKNLVDGVVTDDSDVFLFGARSVYKNIFDDRKYVETYFMKDIETELGLTREQLIRMAMLLGSDYTEGVSGIGIVNAIEVVHAFPEDDGLREFREWIESPDPSILGKLDLHTGSNSKKLSKPSRHGTEGMEKNLESGECCDDKQSSSDKQDIKEIFMSKHRNVSKNWHIPSSFPSESVMSAYISPQVDDSTEPFSWGRPDLSLLRKLCWERFGWSKEKADELLLPVLREYDKHETQLRLEAFYSFNERFAKIRSQRIKKAIKGITGKQFPDTDELAEDSPNTNNDVGSSGRVRGRGQRKKNAGRGTTGDQDPTIDDANGFDELVQDSSSNIRKKKRVSSSGPPRGRGRRNTNARLGTREGQDTKIDAADLASDDYSHEEDFANQTSSADMALRRSKRHRKQVSYAEDGCEADNVDVLANQIDERGLAVKDAQADRFHQDMNEPQTDHIHQAANSVGVPLDKKSEDVRQDASGFELCEDRPVDAASGDYLFTGGGFCMEESEEHGDATVEPSTGQARMEPAEELMMEQETIKAGEQNRDFTGFDQVMTLSNAEEAAENAMDTARRASSRGRFAGRGLSAMPTLKRRRGRS